MSTSTFSVVRDGQPVVRAFTTAARAVFPSTRDQTGATYSAEDLLGCSEDRRDIVLTNDMLVLYWNALLNTRALLCIPDISIVSEATKYLAEHGAAYDLLDHAICLEFTAEWLGVPAIRGDDPWSQLIDKSKLSDVVEALTNVCRDVLPVIRDELESKFDSTLLDSDAPEWKDGVRDRISENLRLFSELQAHERRSQASLAAARDRIARKRREREEGKGLSIV